VNSEPATAFTTSVTCVPINIPTIISHLQSDSNRVQIAKLDQLNCATPVHVSYGLLTQSKKELIAYFRLV
jgi:hypothetical protein